MTESPSPVAPAPLRVAARASTLGAVLTAGVLTVVILLTSTEIIPVASRRYLFFGALLGLAAGSLGNLIVARGALLRVGGPLASADFVRSIVLDFVVQVLAVAAGLLAVRFLLAVKFQELAAFGLTLAGTVVLARVPGTILVSRALDLRARSKGGAERVIGSSEDAD